MSRLASKTVFSGLEWKAFFAESPILHETNEHARGGLLVEYLQSFLVSEGHP